jgi:tripartite-type tricarboxylate transporter receptor subunit TctC
MLATGKVKYLGVSTLKATPVVPGVPAIADALPGFKSAAWFGLLAPKGTPDEIVQKLNAAVVAAVARPEIHKLFTGRNVEARSSTPAEMENLIKDEIQQWKPVIQGARIEM